MHHPSCQKFSPKPRPKTSAQNSGHDFLSGDFVDNLQQVLGSLSFPFPTFGAAYFFIFPNLGPAKFIKISAQKSGH